MNLLNKFNLPDSILEVITTQVEEKISMQMRTKGIGNIQVKRFETATYSRLFLILVS